MSDSLKIFLSYAREDRERVLALYQRLKADGFSPWMAETDLLPGQSWRVEIARAIRRSDVFVFFISKSSVGRAGFVQKELRTAYDLWQERPEGDIFLIPVLLEPTEIPKELREVQSVYLFEEGGYEQVVRSLRRLADRRQEALSRGVTTPPNLQLSSVELVNIRCFRELKLELVTEAGEPIHWVMILGDNAAGKSTLLRSIALGLSNESDTVALMKEVPGKFVREGASEGHIKLGLIETVSGRFFSLTTYIIRSAENNEGVRKVSEPGSGFPWSEIFVCGYGTQRSQQSHASHESYTVHDAVESLFNDSVSLQNPEVILLRQAPDIRANIERRLLEVLLLDDQEFEIAYPKTGFEIRGPWGELPLPVLSDGYRSMAQWLLDFIGWLIHAERFIGNPEIGGILLLDEIEQHLHPYWQRYLLKRLRKQFPLTQMFTSTHTPLMAAGLADIERSLLLRLDRVEDGSIEARTMDPRDLTGKRADQVLASDAFGLVTSRSPDSESSLHRYAELLGRRSRNSAEEEELENLAQQLQSAFRFGENEFERGVEAAVSRALKNMVLEARPELLDLETRKQLRAIFRSEESN